jgi:hypothetical protein
MLGLIKPAAAIPTVDELALGLKRDGVFPVHPVRRVLGTTANIELAPLEDKPVREEGERLKLRLIRAAFAPWRLRSGGGYGCLAQPGLACRGPRAGLLLANLPP